MILLSTHLVELELDTLDVQEQHTELEKPTSLDMCMKRTKRVSPW
jgi:hypothetical protein